MQKKIKAWFDKNYVRLMVIANMDTKIMGKVMPGLALAEVMDEFSNKFKKETTPFLVLWSQYVDERGE